MLWNPRTPRHPDNALLMPYQDPEKRRDKRREYDKRYREENREKIRGYQKRYYKENSEKVRKRNKCYREENYEEVREREKRYREENRREVLEGKKRYREENSEKLRGMDRRRRELQHHAMRSAPYAEEYVALIAKDPCSYCGGEREHIDHIIPLSKGGTGDWDNLAPACARCNLSKGTKSPLEFLLARREGLGGRCTG